MVLKWQHTGGSWFFTTRRCSYPWGQTDSKTVATRWQREARVVKRSPPGTYHPQVAYYDFRLSGQSARPSVCIAAVRFDQSLGIRHDLHCHQACQWTWLVSWAQRRHSIGGKHAC
ncbi:hypothetical protein CC80DRAFT_14351 [Byssothecium circinans]|uniref:Uncharacterized protein n=1 Tax=Byssothecium circinans TaxID=147558 RepID=A0A6A5U124_9PLEO|nr:hypothetical protein CC80DRAFT_14351 [Byssothecium circinans]